jgi:hypothetical protein
MDCTEWRSLAWILIPTPNHEVLPNCWCISRNGGSLSFDDSTLKLKVLMMNSYVSDCIGGNYKMATDSPIQSPIQ